MFWNETIKSLDWTIRKISERKNQEIQEIQESCTSHENKLNEQDKRLNCHADEIEEINKKISFLYESNELYEKAFKEIRDEIDQINNKINAIIECINGDRKDINCLIQIIKKIQTNSTKRRK